MPGPGMKACAARSSSCARIRSYRACALASRAFVSAICVGDLRELALRRIHAGDGSRQFQLLRIDLGLDLVQPASASAAAWRADCT